MAQSIIQANHPLLLREFYSAETLQVARQLLGMVLRKGSVWLRITEVEAYRWPDDSANHCRAGRTKRNEPMWGASGHAYVYLCYGIHSMLNVVTDQAGHGAAVLIRSCEPLAGESTIRKRRGGLDGPALLTGPGKVAAALGLTTKWSGHCLYEAGGLELRRGGAPGRVLQGPRVGIGYAEQRHQNAPWRLALADNAWVSRRKLLRPAK